MQSEEDLWLQSFLLQGLSETDRRLQVVLGHGRKQDQRQSEREGSPVNGHRLFGLKVLVDQDSLFWIYMLPLHHIPAKPNNVFTCLSEPGQVSSDGDCSEVKRSEASSNLLEGRAVAGITSEEEAMIGTQNRPAAPQRLRGKSTR